MVQGGASGGRMIGLAGRCVCGGVAVVLHHSVLRVGSFRVVRRRLTAMRICAVAGMIIQQ